jgi:hypothetical protein
MRNIQVNIFDTNLSWRGMIEEIQSLIHRTSWNEITYSEMKVSKNASSFSELKVGRILIVNNRLDKSLIVEEIYSSIPEEFVNVILMPLKGILNYRVLVPEDSSDFINKNQGFIMSELVREQLITQTRDINRRFTNDSGVNLLSVTTRNNGDLVNYYTTEWLNSSLGDVIVQLSKMNTVSPSIGWNIYINPDYSGMTFDTYISADRTTKQTTVPPVVFSSDFGNIQKIDYIESIKDWANSIYIIFENEQEVATYISTNNQKDGIAKSFNRKEIILESNQNTNSSALSDGISELNKRPKINSFECEIIDNPNTMSTFEKDWFLGDFVSIQVKELGLQMDSQVTEVEEIFADGLYSINVTFSEAKLSILKVIKNALQLKRKTK